MTAAPPIDRLAPARRPDGRPVGYQSWRHLTFLHWRVPAGAVRPTLPAGLELDTFDGDAWIGLVPFLMEGVRPSWSPPIAGVSRFPETNVRTYVTRTNAKGEREPGVYFYSLDAAKWLAVAVARAVWRLPYFRASMSVDRDGDRVRYESRRLWPGPRGAGGRIEVTVTGPPAPPEPGTLDHFLVERYLLFTPGALKNRGGAVLRGQVSHPPYPLRPARVDRCEDSLLAAAGFAGLAGPGGKVARPPDHTGFADGVDVEIFPLRPG